MSQERAGPAPGLDPSSVMSQRSEADSRSSIEGRVRTLAERDRLAAEQGAGASGDVERCATLARDVLALTGRSTDLVSIAEGLHLEGIASRLDETEPPRIAGAPEVKAQLASAVRQPEAPLAVSGPLSPVLRRLGALTGEAGHLYLTEFPGSDGPPGLLSVASTRPLSEPAQQLLLDVAALLGQLLTRERRETRYRERIDAREEALGVVAHDLRNPI